MKKIPVKTILIMLIIMLGKTTNAQQWHPLNTGVTEDLYNICCLDENTIFICGQNGVILKTDDGGATWQEKHREPGQEALSIRFDDNGNGYCLMGKGPSCLLKSEDNGETWFNITLNYPKTKIMELGKDYGTEFWTMYGKPAEMHLTNSDIIFISQIGGLNRSTDGGATFDYVDLGFDWESKVFAFFDGSRGLVIGRDDNSENMMKIWKTVDYGESWENTANYDFSMFSISSVYFENESHVIIYGDFYEMNCQSYNVMETADGFENITMSAVSGIYSDDFFDVDFSAERGCYIGSMEFDKNPNIQSWSYVTEDGGASWSEVSYGINNHEFMYDVSAFDITFLVASQKGVLYKYDSSPLLETEENKIEVGVFPNPAECFLEINVKDAKTIEIFNNLGICIIEIPTKHNPIVVDVSKLTPSVYYIIITDDNGIRHTERIIKL